MLIFPDNESTGYLSKTNKNINKTPDREFYPSFFEANKKICQ